MPEVQELKQCRLTRPKQNKHIHVRCLINSILEHNETECTGFDWPDCVVKKYSVDRCLRIRFERSKIDDSKTLHVLDEVL